MLLYLDRLLDYILYSYILILELFLVIEVFSEL